MPQDTKHLPSLEGASKKHNSNVLGSYRQPKLILYEDFTRTSDLVRAADLRGLIRWFALPACGWVGKMLKRMKNPKPAWVMADRLGKNARKRSDSHRSGADCFGLPPTFSCRPHRYLLPSSCHPNKNDVQNINFLHCQGRLLLLAGI